MSGASEAAQARRRLLQQAQGGGAEVPAQAPVPGEARAQETLAEGLQGTPGLPSGAQSAADQRRSLIRMHRAAEQGPDYAEADFMRMALGQDDTQGPALEPWQRFALHFFADSFEEQKTEFRKHYPQGELEYVPSFGPGSESRLVFRKNPEEKFRDVDPDFFKGMNGMFGGQRALEDMPGDVMDFLGGAGPEIAGELLGVLLASRIPGGNFMWRILFGGAGAGAGEGAQQGLQVARGTQQDSFGEAAGRAAWESGFSLIGGTIGEGITGARNIRRQRGLFPVSEETNRMRRESIAEGFEDVLPGQASEVGLVRLIGRQAQATFHQITDYVRLQNSQARARLRGALRSGTKRGELRRLVKEELDQSFVNILAFTRSALAHTPTNKAQAISIMQEGVEKWWKASGDDVTELYRIAHAGVPEGVGYDWTRAHQKISDIETRAVALVENTTEVPIRAANGKALVSENGEPLMREVTESELVQLREFETGFKNIMEKIKAVTELKPTPVTLADGTEVIRSPETQILELTKDLYDLTIPDFGGPRLNQALAKELRGELLDILENPTGVPEGAMRPFREAAEAAKNRFRTREQIVVEQITSPGGRAANQPRKMARSLMQRDSADELFSLKAAMPEAEYNAIRDAYTEELLSEAGKNPTFLKQHIDAMDAETFNELIPRPGDRRVLQEAADAMAGLSQSGIKKAIDEQTRWLGFFNQLLGDQQSTATIDQVHALVAQAGGLDSELAQSIQASIGEAMWQRVKSMSRQETQDVISAGQLRTVISDFQQKGIWDFLTPLQKRTLGRVETYMNYIKRSGLDTSSTLVAGLEGAELRKNPFAMETIQSLSSLFGTGVFLTSKAGRHLLIGNPNSRHTAIRVMDSVKGAATLLRQATVEWEQQRQKKRDPKVQAEVDKIIGR